MLPRSVTVRKYLLTVTLFPCSEGVTVTKDVWSVKYEQTNVTLASFGTQGECKLMTRSRETELFNETHCMKPELSELERKSTKSNAICSTKQNDLRGPFALYSPSFALSLLSLSSGWGREKERKKEKTEQDFSMNEGSVAKMKSKISHEDMQTLLAIRTAFFIFATSSSACVKHWEGKESILCLLFLSRQPITFIRQCFMFLAILCSSITSYSFGRTTLEKTRPLASHFNQIMATWSHFLSW